MKRFFTFFFIALLACFSVAKTNAQVVGACPPITVNTVVITPFVATATSGCPTVDEIQLFASTQYNSYYLYLYAGSSMGGTPLRSVELVGATTSDLAIFGDAIFTAGTTYTVQAVPVSTNLGAMPQYALTPATFTYPLIVTPAANARGALPTLPTFFDCNGIIDVNIVTRTGTTPPWNCVLPSNIGVFKGKLFGGDKPEPITLQTAGIRLLAIGSTPAQCLTDDEFLHYLYNRCLITGNKVLFHFKDPVTGLPVELVYGIARPRAVVHSPIDKQDYINFVTDIQSFWSSNLFKYLTDTNQYLYLEVRP
jgi:hypothetical protein